MQKIKFLALVIFIFVLINGCGKDNKGGNETPIGSIGLKNGWNAELIDRLIACQPNPSDICNCVIPIVTAKYTPAQVQEKSPYVAADMLEIKASCSKAGEEPVQPTLWSYEFKADGCTTGIVSYSNVQEHCDALQSDSKNNHCALYARKEEFKRSCQGEFVQKP